MLPKGKKTIVCYLKGKLYVTQMGVFNLISCRWNHQKIQNKTRSQRVYIDIWGRLMETFSPVAKIDTVRILFSVVANKDWPLYQFDVKKFLPSW